MVEEHLMSDHEGGTVRRQFDVDANIGAALQRLRNGTFDESDIVLLEHELAESRYLQDHRKRPTNKRMLSPMPRSTGSTPSGGNDVAAIIYFEKPLEDAEHLT